MSRDNKMMVGPVPGGGGGGGYFRTFWVGMCSWDPGALSLYKC